MKKLSIHERLNQTNQDDYSARSSSDFRRSLDIDITHANLNNVDEKTYSSSYRVNGKNIKHRTIKMSNKEWHKLNQK